jgi:undecaprenyl phosphate N,N'-diacetylbacillosamine 1-phosphate transferase
MYKIFFKRIFDLIIATIGLIMTLPFLIIIYLILYRQNRGAAFFFQERPGKNQLPFNIIKFKTMSDARDNSGILLPDNQRITKAGKIIRKLSIDELPQLLNVLKGDMSLIGPRPLLYKYMSLYSE